MYYVLVLVGVIYEMIFFIWQTTRGTNCPQTSLDGLNNSIEENDL